MDRMLRSRPQTFPVSESPDAGQSSRLWKITVRLSWLLYVGVLWSFVVQHSTQPRPLPVSFDIVVGTAAATVLFALYRKYSFSFLVSVRDLLVIAGYGISFSLLNLTMLRESITSDELLHASDSMIFLHVIRVLLDHGIASNTLLRHPLNDLVFFFSAVVIAFVGLSAVLVRKIDEARRKILFYAVLSAAGIVAGILTCGINHVQSPHPPMRLLPLFVVQTLFGLSDTALRVPGLICCALLSFVTYRLILKKRPGEHVFAAAVGFALYLIPTVFHTSAIVEPSIWAFATWVSCAYLIYLACEKNDFAYLVAAGVVTGLGSLMRQNCIVLWPVIGLVFLLTPRFRTPFLKNSLMLFLPAMLIVPYMLTVRVVGHGIAGGSTWVNVIESLSTGRCLDVWINTTGYFWLISGMGLVLLGCSSVRSKSCLFFLALIPAFCVYFSIPPWTQGISRYQVEYVAPIISFAIYLSAVGIHSRHKVAFLILLCFLGIYSVHANRTLYQDLDFQSYPDRRISTQKHAPLKAAISFIQQQNSGGRFVILSGVGLSSDWLIASHGFSLMELQEQARLTSAVQDFTRSADGADGNKFVRLLEDKGVHYLLLYYGNRMELAHRSMNCPNLHNLFAYMGYFCQEQQSGKQLPFVLMHTFYDNLEGAIDVYGRPALRYGPYLPRNQ